MKEHVVGKNIPVCVGEGGVVVLSIEFFSHVRSVSQHRHNQINECVFI